MAATSKSGGGQGKVRQYKSGTIVRCSDEQAGVQCQRAMRYINLAKDGETPTDYKCGLAPLVPKVRSKRK